VGLFLLFALGKTLMKTWIRIGVLTLALVVLAMLLHGIRVVSPKQVETEIDQSLSPASDKDNVLHFLDTNHIRYIGCVPAVRTCYGKIDRSSIGLMKGQIYIEFQFGENGKLASHTIREWVVFWWE
jgi:hypothetical protein